MQAFTHQRAQRWFQLWNRSQKRPRTVAEVDALVEEYQSVSADLTVLRTRGGDPVAVRYVSATLAAARLRILGSRDSFSQSLAHFWGQAFPAAVWRARGFILFSFLFSMAVSVAVATWVTRNPEVVQAMGTEEELRRYVETDFVEYYSSGPAQFFAANVWTNNAWVSAQAIGMGITGIGVIYVLLMNFVGLGQVAGLMVIYDRLPMFFALILPHGLLELTCIWVAAGAGLKVFWAWVAPGNRTRTYALVSEGRSMISVALGLAGVLAVAGFWEGFVTPSGLPVWMRVGSGALVWGLFLVYVWRWGRPAAQAGQTGDLRSGLVEASPEFSD